MNTKLPAQLPDDMRQRLRALAEEADAAGIPFIAIAITQGLDKEEKMVHISAANETLRNRMSDAESFREDLEIAVAYAAAKQKSPEKLALALAALVDVPMELFFRNGHCRVFKNTLNRRSNMTTVEFVRVQYAVNLRRKRVRRYAIAALGCLAGACIAGALLWGLVS